MTELGPLLSVDRMTCTYGTEPVLANVSFEVRPTDFIGVVGPSGSGKTTLLKALLGSVPAVAGSVRRRKDLSVAYVPQVETIDWDFPITVGECVLMGRTGSRLLPWPSRAEKAEVGKVLGRLGIASLQNRHIRELSGGQQQRVFIARALLRRPQLLLMDEPTSGVDLKTRHEVLHLLEELNRDGLAILLTTHDLNGIAAHLPTLLCLNVEVIGMGPPRSVLTPQVLERTYGARMEV
ncbi:MAG TPA: metal ABC transporter ATP-binding protein, partial [Actinomycetota bacterium]|nr:metal ABC transporter ATP-binding protein [Actinomycetota bacterium]